MLSVVIPTYNRASDLSRCLDVLVHQLGAEDEIVVVAEPTDQETQDVVCNLAPKNGRIRLLFSNQSGPAQAYMIGLTSCRGNLIGLVDDDSIPCEGWVAKVKGALSSQDAGAIGGPVISTTNESRSLIFPNLIGKLFWFGAIIGNESRLPISDEVLEVDHLRGANMAFRRSENPLILPHLRGDVFRFELDICLSLKEDGYKILFDPSLYVLHADAERSSGFERKGTVQSCYDRAYNNTLVVLRHTSGFRRGISFLFSLLVGDGATPGIALWTALSSRYSRLMVQRCFESVRGRFDALRDFELEIDESL